MRPILGTCQPRSDLLTGAFNDVEASVTTVGPNRPRIQQHMVFLLVPDTVAVKEFAGREDTLFSTQQTRAQDAYKKLHDLAR